MIDELFYPSGGAVGQAHEWHVFQGAPHGTPVPTREQPTGTHQAIRSIR
jgi:hypothetical protein